MFSLAQVSGGADDSDAYEKDGGDNDSGLDIGSMVIVVVIVMK